MRANERSERPSGPLKTRLSVTRNTPILEFHLTQKTVSQVSENAIGVSKLMNRVSERNAANEWNERCKQTNVGTDQVALNKRDCHV